MMFAALVLERDPLTLERILTSGLWTWLQIVGALAALVVWGGGAVKLLAWRRRLPIFPSDRLMPLFWVLCLLFTVLYVGVGVLFLPEVLHPGQEPFAPWVPDAITWGLRAAGGLALLAFALNFLENLLQLRLRRIGALARLSFKEAIRRRVLYVFCGLLLIFLFANWFVRSKPEDQVRSSVQIVSFAMTILLLVSAGLVSAFSIPNDIKQQTIHTVVTKPVERFEIVLGRFFGYTLLMTLVLVILTTLSLGFVLRSTNPDAASESIKARDPVYGALSFETMNEVGEKNTLNPENVGREWDYRSYISGPTRGKPAQYAVWTFTDMPGKLAERKDLRCEFNLDIYRTTKGEENKGVTCTFLFETWRFRPRNAQVYNSDPRKNTPEGANALAEEYGYYEVGGKQITDYKTLFVDIPASILKNQRISRGDLQQVVAKHEVTVQELRKRAADLIQTIEPLRSRQAKAVLASAGGVSLGTSLLRRQQATLLGAGTGLMGGTASLEAVLPGIDPAQLRLTPEEEQGLLALEGQLSRSQTELYQAEEMLRQAREDESTLAELEKKGQARPPFRVRVRCDTRTQFVGMAKYDLYFRADDPQGGRDMAAFAWNFYKGSFGLWLRLCLMIGLSVFLSTELGGVISWLCAAVLYIGGIFRDFIESLARGGNVGGGPLESFFRLVKRENMNIPLEETTATKVATGSDVVFRWVVGRVMNLLPDIDRFDFTDYVANGFNIAVVTQDMLPAFLLLVGYLLPWAILAYYLMKAREIAGPN